MPAHLCFDHVSCRFGRFTAVDQVSLEINKGEVFSLLGPSGCGKTTLLRMAAGFQSPDEGRILLNGKDITALPPNERPLNTVFQSYALFPHLSIRENILFGPKISRRDKKEAAGDLERMLDLVDLTAHADKKPAQLSGGQKQRVASARALINRPEVLLLDEPLAALDLKLRQRLLIELDTLHDEVGITFVYVTHDQGEAMSISDRVAVMHQGVVEQVGTPVEVYEAPRSSFVAAFIGDTNFLDGKIMENLDERFSRCRIESLGEVIIDRDRPHKPGDMVHVSLRPEKIWVTREAAAVSPLHNHVEGTVEDVIYFGSHTRYWVRCGEWRLCAEMQHRNFLLDETPPRWGDRVWLRWHAKDGYLLESYAVEDEAMLTLPDAEAASDAGEPLT